MWGRSKTTPGIRVTAQTIANAAGEHGKATALDVVQGLVDAHTLNQGDESPLTPLSPKTKRIVTKELEQLAETDFAKGNTGFVDFRKRGTGAHAQTLAEHVDRLVSNNLRLNDKRKQAEDIAADSIRIGIEGPDRKK